MIRITLEEAAWEAWQQIGEDLFRNLSVSDSAFLRRVFGIFPYQSHTIKQMSEMNRIPYTTCYSRYRKILREIRPIALKLLKTR